MSKSDSDMILEMYKILQEVRDDLKTKPSRDEMNERFDHVFTVLDRQSSK